MIDDMAVYIAIKERPLSSGASDKKATQSAQVYMDCWG